MHNYNSDPIDGFKEEIKMLKEDIRNELSVLKEKVETLRGYL